jgi:4-hydroxy-tetrahydrodipicolinate reductase
MNIALLGHGKMGKEVAELAREKGLHVTAIFTGQNNRGGTGLTPQSLADVEVCIDFSAPTAVVENIEGVARCGKDIVVGTTGWLDRLDHVQRVVVESGTGLLYASNFSPGVNVFFRLIEEAAKMFDRQDGYDVGVHEVHHREKADCPSGTALSIASLILRNLSRKTEVVHGTPEKRIEPQQFLVTSARLGHVQGKHTVTFDSGSDTIELVHTAKSRRGFAEGALLAASWLAGKKGVFTMNDVTFP